MSFFNRQFVSFNVFVYRITKGRLGSRLRDQQVLLLHTVGRSSGKTYTTPLSYYRDGNNYLVVASAWGAKEQPDWFRNLMQSPRTTIQVRDQTIEVKARQTAGKEYDRLWDIVSRQNASYVEYQRKLQRRIPIVTLTPAV